MFSELRSAPLLLLLIVTRSKSTLVSVSFHDDGGGGARVGLRVLSCSPLLFPMSQSVNANWLDVVVFSLLLRCSCLLVPGTMVVGSHFRARDTPAPRVRVFPVLSRNILNPINGSGVSFRLVQFSNFIGKNYFFQKSIFI